MNFNTLEGLVISQIRGCYKNSEEIEITTTDGRRFHMFHYQDCCESVRVEDVVGDVEDIVGSTILRAEERSNGVHNLEQWTFYTISTIKGTVDLRWYGTSNGYYGTSVEFDEVDPNV